MEQDVTCMVLAALNNWGGGLMESDMYRFRHFGMLHVGTEMTYRYMSTYVHDFRWHFSGSNFVYDSRRGQGGRNNNSEFVPCVACIAK